MKFPWLSSTQLHTLTFRTLLLLFGIDVQLMLNDSMMTTSCAACRIEIHTKYENCRT